MTNPVNAGSGGGSINGPGGWGGGALKLIVTGTLTVNGILSANGTDGAGGSTAGGGAGGSLWLQINNLAGNGKILANGTILIGNDES